MIRRLRSDRSFVAMLAITSCSLASGCPSLTAARGPDDGGASLDGGDAGAGARDSAAVVDGAPDSAASGFRHPGVLVNRDQLDVVRAKVGASSAPWKAAFDAAAASKHASLAYAAAPVAVVQCGPFSNPDVGCTAEKSDATAAYTHALLYALGGDVAHAQKATAIMNAWSAILTDHTLSNAPLQSAWVGSVWPRAAEIMRYIYAGWPAAEIDRFATMLRTVYLPRVISGAAKENGNWELSMAEATIAIAVFLDDRATFDKGLSMWRKRVPAYVYMASDGALPVPPPGAGITTQQALVAYWQGQSTFTSGLAQETCRDLGHTQYGLAAIINAAETARIQGVDLYAEQATRLTAAYEFHAAYLDGDAVPSSLCGGTLNAVTPDPTWEIGYNAYAKRAGAPLPRTATLVTKIRPTGVDHHMDWETLTHAEVGAVGIP